MFIKTFTGRFLPRWAKHTPIICCTSQNVSFISPACLCSSIFTSLFTGKAKVAPIREWLVWPRRSQLEIIYWCVKEISWQHHACTLWVLPRVIRRLFKIMNSEMEGGSGSSRDVIQTYFTQGCLYPEQTSRRMLVLMDGMRVWSTNEKAWSQYNNTHWR